MSRTELLNDLIQKIGAKSYLEIGIHDGANFDAIVCAKKVGVDPVSFPWKNPELIQVDTSDSFFARNAVFDTDGFDVIFIDGLHEADQVLRDIKNALKVLSKDGYIVTSAGCTLSLELLSINPGRDTKTCFSVISV